MTRFHPHGRASATVLILVAAFAAALGLWFGARMLDRPAQPALRSALLYPAPRALPAFELLRSDGKPLTLATTVNLAPAGKGRRITLASLSGTLDAKKFNLSGPAVVTLDGAATRLDGLSLAFDKARIEASGSLAPRAVSAKLAAMGRMGAGIAHQLNSPLCGAVTGAFL